MTRLTRLLRCAITVACSSVAASVAFVPAAVADSIPRPPGAVDNRGYELVSLADNDLNPLLQATPLSSDGTRVVYNLAGPAPGSPSGVYPTQRAMRTASGWQSEQMLPPRSQMPASSFTYLISAAPADLSSVVETANDGLGKSTTSTTVSLTTLDGAGGQLILHTFPVYFGTSGLEVVASENLQHLFVDVAADADPSLPGNAPGVQNLYDFGSGRKSVV